MVPGLTEREVRAAELRRRELLAEAARGRGAAPVAEPRRRWNRLVRAVAVAGTPTRP